MAFDYLLKHALVPGVTSCEEEGKGIRLDPIGDETIIVFHLDNPKVRTQFKLTEEHCCDYLFFYKHKDKPAFLLFVELKGRDGIDTAAKQILSAYHALCPDGCEMRAEAKGLIVSPNPFPKKKLQQHSSRADIRLFYVSVKKNKCDLREVQELKAYFQSSDRKRRR